MRVASIGRVAPPMLVQARPVITPTPDSTCSLRNTGLPRDVSRSFGPSLITAFGSSSSFITALRTSLPRFFSSWRTPASRA
ncbi:hypothetical protein D3C85_1309250 [compost metagenome]